MCIVKINSCKRKALWNLIANCSNEVQLLINKLLFFWFTLFLHILRQLSTSWAGNALIDVTGCRQLIWECFNLLCTCLYLYSHFHVACCYKPSPG